MFTLQRCLKLGRRRPMPVAVKRTGIRPTVYRKKIKRYKILTVLFFLKFWDGYTVCDAQ